MRSNLITVVTAVASMVLVASMASADQVQEQFRLMEQRMAEMEDRLEATSDDLRTARATVTSSSRCSLTRALLMPPTRAFGPPSVASSNPSTSPASRRRATTTASLSQMTLMVATPFSRTLTRTPSRLIRFG